MAIAIQCMCCGIARTRPQYFREAEGILDSQARPFYDHRDSLIITELPGGRLRYCQQCLKHAQVVLTNLLGYDTIRDMLNSELPHRFKAFAIERKGKYWWAADTSRYIVETIRDRQCD